ncbi:FliH/SctL family protein [Magnetospirillum fulvum]|uniref:Flagellar assembly protein FliH n=1 Tax=Magnetospirillum fulvum MGU-K5 TaxID=1316936 RepID=S9TW94_MAGFU|nr:FliH/SctL family protein [Magnetospirillum fulvum]EPY02665.1 flagellar assembly protein H [Magnetospirillum fulvum MGU-K5]
MAYRKYMFDLDFDPPGGGTRQRAPMTAETEIAMAEPAPPPVEVAPPPPTFTEEDLQLVRDSAFEEGRRSGLEEAAQSAERQLADAMTMLAGGFASLKEAEAQSADEAQRVAARVAMAVLRKVLPATCETNAFEEVIRTVLDCFANVLDEPRIIVRVVPSLVDPVRERLESQAGLHGFEGRVVVQADPRLPPGDCRVEWTDGGAERDQVRLIADIEAAVERALAPPERGSEAADAES